MRGEPASEDSESATGADGRLLWLPIVAAPLGIAVVILLSMMVSGWRVEQALIVQAEPLWRAGEEVAVRVQHIDAERQAIVGAEVRAIVEQGARSEELGRLADPAGAGIAAGRVQVPALTPGAATLRLEVAAPGLAALSERVPIEIVETRPPRAAALTISQSMLNWGDNTEPQPEGLRIVVRPDRRLLAGFDNTLRVRVTDPEGGPLVRPVEVALVTGELLGARGSSSSPPVIAAGTTDRLGLFTFMGPLASDVIELEVRVLAPPAEGAAGAAAATPGAVERPAAAEKPGAPAKPGEASPASATPAPPAPSAATGKRRFRMVSFAGGAQLDGEPLAVRAGEPVSIAARGLRTKRPIFVDVHATDGTWIDTLEPFVGREPPRPWSTARVAPGVAQVEGYYFTNDPGESTALFRFQVVEGEIGDPATLAPLLASHREVLDLPRVEKSFDRAVETRYLERLEALAKAPEEVASARAWLLGTLPVRLWGPPTLANTLERVEAELRARKLAWYDGLRIFLLGGGSAFLLLTLGLLVRRHGQTARSTMRALGSEGAEVAEAIRRAQRGALWRAGAVVVTMGLGLVLTAVVLERILWKL